MGIDRNIEKLLGRARKGIVFRAERDFVLRSLDVQKMKEFFTRWQQPWPPSFSKPNIPLAAMHKARLDILAFTPPEKLFSALWLIGHQFELPEQLKLVVHKDPNGQVPIRYELIGAEYEQ